MQECRNANNAGNADNANNAGNAGNCEKKLDSLIQQGGVVEVIVVTVINKQAGSFFNGFDHRFD
jgi:hypothetical protein